MINRRRLGRYEKVFLIALFGIIGIYGTYSGIPVYGALANSRVLGPVVGGLLGGTSVGLGAGLIAGFHRFLLGGFTGLACGIATVLEGLLGGLIHYKLKGKTLTWPVALLVGFIAEILQMVIILLIAKPYLKALVLVKTIGLPMIGVNSLGICIFFIIIRSIISGQNRVQVEIAQRTLSITNLTLPFLRNGLNEESAQKAAEIIYKLSNFTAVAITDDHKILAHVGTGSDHHKPGLSILTNSSKEVLETNKTVVAKSSEEIGCNHKGCHLGGAVLAPLRQKSEVIGIIKLYRESIEVNLELDIEFAKGLAAIFETQMELAQIERQRELVAKAELRALQAQINPHFLFNALNTISTFVRTKPDSARDLLHHLSDFFRKNLHGGKEMVTLHEEINHVQDYLAIEKARFGEKLNVTIDLPPEILQVTVPSLILQPLVENAVRHGIASSRKGGSICINGKKVKGNMLIVVSDDGVGITPEKLKELLIKEVSSEIGAGIGLRNVHERLLNLYGKDYPLKIESQPNKGTKVSLRIPLARKE